MDSIYIIKASQNIFSYYHLSNVVIILFVCFLFSLIDFVQIPFDVNYTPSFAGILSQGNVHLIWREILFRREDKTKICVVGANYICFHPLFSYEYII